MTKGADRPEEPAALDRDIDAVAALKDPVRRSLLSYVSRVQGDVSRDQAAEALGIARPLAAFHLDKLVDHELLEVSFRRLSGKAGPGAGRPSKLYRRSQRELTVSLPARDYELPARLFARALDEVADAQLTTRVCDLARDLGQSVGARARVAGDRAHPARLEQLTGELAGQGFGPYREAGQIYLRNCPFHALSRDHTELVCGMNLALLSGLVDGVGASGVEARLDPGPGRCCVVLTTTSHQRVGVAERPGGCDPAGS